MTALESLTGLDRGHPLRGMESRAGHTCIISCVANASWNKEQVDQTCSQSRA